MRTILVSFTEGHAYKEEAYGTVSGTKSEISNFGQISGYTKYKQYGEYFLASSVLEAMLIMCLISYYPCPSGAPICLGNKTWICRKKITPQK